MMGLGKPQLHANKSEYESWCCWVCCVSTERWMTTFSRLLVRFLVYFHIALLKFQRAGKIAHLYTWNWKVRTCSRKTWFIMVWICSCCLKCTKFILRKNYYKKAELMLKMHAIAVCSLLNGILLYSLCLALWAAKADRTHPLDLSVSLRTHPMYAVAGWVVGLAVGFGIYPWRICRPHHGQSLANMLTTLILPTRSQHIWQKQNVARCLTVQRNTCMTEQV